MSVGQMILAGLLVAFFALALGRIFRSPLRLAARVLGNTALGFAALWAVGLTAPVTGLSLGLNLWNALVIGVLGLPGFVLLLLTEWVI